MRYATYIYDDHNLIVCHLVNTVEEGEQLLERLVVLEQNEIGMERAHIRVWSDDDRLGDVVAAYEVRQTYELVRIWNL
jgi:hypothetical protein